MLIQTDADANLMLSLRRLRSRVYGLSAIIIILIFGSYVTLSVPNYEEQIKQRAINRQENSAEKPSGLWCDSTVQACLVRNLFVSDETLRVYVDPAADDSTWYGHVLHAGPGIASLRFKYDDEKEENLDENGMHPLDPMTNAVVYVTQGRKSPKTPTHSMQPLFVPWDCINLFCTLWTAASIWHTMKHKHGPAMSMVSHATHLVLLGHPKQAAQTAPWAALLARLLDRPVVSLANMPNGRYGMALLGAGVPIVSNYKELWADLHDEERQSFLRDFRLHLLRKLEVPMSQSRSGSSKLSAPVRIACTTRCNELRQLLPNAQIDCVSVRDPTALTTSLATSMFQADLLVGMAEPELMAMMFLMPAGRTILELSTPSPLLYNLAEVMGSIHMTLALPLYILTGTDASMAVNDSAIISSFAEEQDQLVARMHHISRFAASRARSTEPTKFLLYLPWEQLGNQLNGFSSACAVALLLNRVLVLPFIGYRHKSSGSPQGELFNVFSFVWNPFERYFDLKVASESLPCQFMDWNNFVHINANRAISARYHPLGDDTNQDQMRDYFEGVAGLRFAQLDLDVNIEYELSAAQLLEFHGQDPAFALALGTMFHYYNFGIQRVHPVSQYYDFLASPLYSSIQQGLQTRAYLFRAAEAVANTIARPFACVHVRRGDIERKCRFYAGRPDLYERCKMPVSYVRPILRDKLYPLNISTLYIATNPNTDTTEFSPLSSEDHFSVIISTPIDSKFDYLQPLTPFDPIEVSLINQIVCQLADVFIGGYFSSFSTRIIEQQALMNKNAIII